MCAYVLKPEFAGKGARAGGRAIREPAQSKPVGGARKRAVDIVGASVALVLLAPLMLFVAGLVRILFGGSAMVAERRVGFDGEAYECYRFRSAAEAGKAPHQTRVQPETPVGCFGNVLRKSSLDELPRLFNVLRGDMSLVGPRPVFPDEIARYGRHARAYLQARPGLTGMWLATGRQDIACAQYYARHWSLALDLWLLAKTVAARQ